MLQGGQEPNTYVKCYLKPDVKKMTKRKTRVVRKTCVPSYMETVSTHILFSSSSIPVYALCSICSITGSSQLRPTYSSSFPSILIPTESLDIVDPENLKYSTFLFSGCEQIPLRRSVLCHLLSYCEQWFHGGFSLVDFALVLSPTTSTFETYLILVYCN